LNLVKLYLHISSYSWASLGPIACTLKSPRISARKMNGNCKLSLICSLFLSPRIITLDHTQKRTWFKYLKIIRYAKFHFSICSFCEEKERKLLLDRPTNKQTDRQTAKQFSLLSLKGVTISKKQNKKQTKANWLFSFNFN
jgi:hypothetical protein